MAVLEGKALLGSVTLLACLGFLLIGFDNGLMSNLINTPAFDAVFHTDPKTSDGASTLALIVSIFEIGCWLGSIITAFIGEKLGRRKSIFIGVCLMLAGTLLQSSSYSVAQMIVARIVSGTGMGFINSTVPVLMAEFAPKATRGVYVCAQLSTLNFGIAMVYWITYGFGTIKGSPTYAWRVPIALQAVFLVPMLFIIIAIPESPRWLIAHNKQEEGLDTLRRLYKRKMSDEAITSIYEEIVNTVAYESSLGTGKWSDLLKQDDIQSRRRLIIACCIQAFQQLGGINALIYYSNTVFQESLGFSDHMASLMGGALNTWFFVASFIPWFLIDRFGRRPLLLSTISVMAAVMIVQTGLIYNVQNKTSIATGCGIGATAMYFIFQGAFTIGFQATVWVYPSEILPLKIRQRGSSVSTSANWMMNFLITYITPPALNHIKYKTYIIFAVLNCCWVPIIYVFFPETKGLALEDVDALFAVHQETRDEFLHVGHSKAVEDSLRIEGKEGSSPA